MNSIEGLATEFSLDRATWSQFVFNHPQGSIFQTPELFEVYNSAINNNAKMLAVVDQDKKVRALQVNVIMREYSGILGKLSSRSIITGGPLIIDKNPHTMNLMQDFYCKKAKGEAVYSQIRNLFIQSQFNHESIVNNGFYYEDHLNIILELSKSEDELWKDVHSKRRNEIRRATKAGTIVRELRSLEEVKEAYGILQNVYRNAKVPLHDFSLFRAAYDILLPNGMVNFFGAFNRNRLIGTLFALCYKDRVFDWYAGSMKDFYHLYPNDILPWEVFLWAKKKGYKTFDFGGAGKPGVPYGVRDYKKKFGGKIVNYGRYEKIHKPFLMKTASLGYKVWRQLKP